MSCIADDETIGAAGFAPPCNSRSWGVSAAERRALTGDNGDESREVAGDACRTDA